MLVEASRETGVEIGDVLGRYRIEAILGSGTMGTVYRGRHVKLSRAVAVKVLHESIVSDPSLRRRFEREAELAGKLTHPNLISIEDFGETNGIHYLVMDLASGPTLGDVMGCRPVATPRLVRLVRQLCDGLDHAHNHGLVHRDFKPDNVIVERAGEPDECVRIVDFGIATLRDGGNATAEKLTQLGMVLGTPQYMAPEYVTGQAVDHRLDLFALGVTVYEMLCGKLPFDGDGVDVARANLVDPIPKMAVRAPDVAVDPLLEAFARKLLEKSPDDRPPSAFAARLVLDMIERDRPAAASMLGIAPQSRPTNPELAALVVSVPPPPIATTIETPMPLPTALFQRARSWVARTSRRIKDTLKMSPVRHDDDTADPTDVKKR